MPAPRASPQPETDSIHSLLRKGGGSMILILTIYACVWMLFSRLNPNSPNQQKELESRRWIATSGSWIDRSLCKTTGICGGVNWLLSTWLFGRPNITQPLKSRHSHRADWIDSDFDPDHLSPGDVIRREIPQYVFNHAPMLYLHASEQWWPTDVADFLHHVKYRRPGQDRFHRIKLQDLDEEFIPPDRSQYGFLESEDDPESLPDWLVSAQNIPGKLPPRVEAIELAVINASFNNISGQDESQRASTQLSEFTSEMQDHQKAHLKTSHFLNLDEDLQSDSKNNAHRSAAPAFLVTVSKDNGTLDAFWFFFYAFNRGARVANIQYGNHIGDWEHVLVRFRDEKPVEAFLSAHEWGSAYDFDVLEKDRVDPRRPVVYAGLGSHAHYATAGKHAYALPFGLLGDDCSKGHLWDPRLNLLSFVYRPSDGKGVEKPTFWASMRNPAIRSNWLRFKGRWGNRKISLGDSKRRNYRFAGEYKYLDGPSGPWDKNLNRESVCEHPRLPCIIRSQRDGYVGPIKGAVGIESYVS